MVMLQCTANGGKRPQDAKFNRYPVYITIGREIPDEKDHPIRFGPPKVFASSDGVLIPGTPGTQIATYSSFIDDGKERLLFYPDRKHFLLARRLTDEWLADCDPASNPIRLRPPVSIYEVQGTSRAANAYSVQW